MIALFLIGVGMAVAGIGWVVPSVEPPLLAERLSEFRKAADSYDVLFFGSSRVFRGIDPKVFDAEMAERGHPLRSYNLGFPAMRPHELNALLRRVLQERPLHSARRKSRW